MGDNNKRKYAKYSKVWNFPFRKIALQKGLLTFNLIALGQNQTF